MTDTSYNGWRNHATWQMALFLNGDYGYDSVPGRDVDVRLAARIGADALKDWVMDALMPDASRNYLADPAGARLFRMDLVTRALEDVDWVELASVYRI